MFSRASNNLFTGGTFNVHMHGSTLGGGFERLQQAVAPSAFHDAGHIIDPPKCHPNTRIAVINKIMDWILGLREDDRNAVILWLYGPAGAGKSAIAHNIAERCNLENLLLASFVFSRSDPTCGNANSLIATIAYQIAINVPQTREKIIAAVEHDPLVLTRSLETQLAALIVNPLRELLDAGYFNISSSRRLIIIDGLDECDTPAVQCKILDIISMLFRQYHLPLLILIASRPERHLTHSFNNEPLRDFHTTLALDDTYRPDDDIRLFLNDTFRKVKDTHPMKTFLGPSWPSVDVVEKLVRKSSGQFIYASTVVKYISSLRHQPADRLNVILRIRPPRHAGEMPFGELDALYSHILSCVDDTKTLLRILGIQLFSPFGALMERVELEHFFSLNEGDIDMLLGDINSIVTFNNQLPYLHMLHASLPDFLLDADRSRHFYVDLSSVHVTCVGPAETLIYYVPTYLTLILLLADDFDDADEIYARNLEVVLDFFVSKLQPYYSNPRLTLLLTYLATIQPVLATFVLPLPLRLKMVDNEGLQLHDVTDVCPNSHFPPDRHIFEDFLNSDHPLAMDGARYATATLDCLQIIFKRYKGGVSGINWFTHHSRALMAGLAIKVEHVWYRQKYMTTADEIVLLLYSF
ncbi:hypothetical protein M413DRAFT_23460 [Hebeloma cylindrosporum]|uniref:Nephrocystin 3-like N-terminal domain-containing protein n=1 Tax=Hebeloma cylindrosporum TaxID=76867 RepID=A0A0C3CEM7_HEBCY|nr:hypothetical protein M413DRAFT_23460 [Hebeloma cylindrosporum h7]